MGTTILSLKKFCADEDIFIKTKFSMMIDPVENWLKNRPEIDTIILCGIETHVGINSTIIDLIARDFTVISIEWDFPRKNLKDSFKFFLIFRFT